MGALSRTIQKGFTIVELMVIIVVIAILATITIVSYDAITDNAHREALSADLQTMRSRLIKYESDNGAYPSNANFPTAIQQENTTGDTEYDYIYGTDDFCLEGQYDDIRLHITFSNSKPDDGGCPG